MDIIYFLSALRYSVVYFEGNPAVRPVRCIGIDRYNDIHPSSCAIGLNSAVTVSISTDTVIFIHSDVLLL
jgi:hypothetical protein